MDEHISAGSAGLIGAPVRRTEDPRLLTGRTCFSGDVVLPRMVEAAVLRSPHPHARIRGIDTSRATASPGVLAVLTGSEIADECGGPQPVTWRMIPDQRMTDGYPLAVDRVRWAGQGVAVVVAADRYLAEDALALIDVDYEALDTVGTLDDALADGAPRLYDDWPDNVSCRQTIPKGDTAAAFDAADVVVSETLHVGRQLAAPLETRCTVASWDTFDDRLDVWISTQAPALARDLLAGLLGLAVERVRVRTPDVGGGFGSKFDLYPEDVLAPLLSRRTGRPVKLAEDRAESFVASTHSREQRIDVAVAARADGTITAMRGTVHAVLGGELATPGIGPAWVTAALMTGPYDIPNAELTVVGVVTNRAPYGSYRGYGQPKSNLAHERIVERLARELGLPANEVRRRNLIAPDAFPYPGAAFFYDNGHYADCLGVAERAVAERGWAERIAAARDEGRSLGVGYSFHVEVSALGPTRILNMVGLQHSAFDEEVLRIEPGGGVTVRTGLSALGQGITTALAQVAAGTLGVPLASVTVYSGDTATSPFTGYGTGGSRAATLGGGALVRAGTRLRGKVLRIAGNLLEAAPDDLEITDGRIRVAGTDGPSVTMADVGNAAYRRLAGALPEDESPTLEERDVFDPPNVATSYGTTAVLVEVDRETGRTGVLEYLVAHDCGTVINPMIVDGQIHGGAAQGIGGALFEELVYGDDGLLRTSSLADLGVPTAAELPAFETLHLDAAPAAQIPGGFKGAGEGGTIGAASAVLAAVENALSDLDIRLRRTPVTPPRLLAAIDEATPGRTATPDGTAR